MVRSALVVVTLGAFDELHHDRDHTVVSAPPLIVQVRRGPMTLGSLSTIDRRIHEARARAVSPGARVALVSVLEEGAPVVGEDVRGV